MCLKTILLLALSTRKLISDLTSMVRSTRNSLTRVDLCGVERVMDNGDMCVAKLSDMDSSMRVSLGADGRQHGKKRKLVRWFN